MNNSRSNRSGTLPEFTRNMNTTSDLTIDKSEYSRDTVNDSLEYDVCTSKDTSDCQAQSKRLLKSENCSVVFTPQIERIKIAQILNSAEPEKLKQTNDNGTDGSRENGGFKDNQNDNINYCQTYYNSDDNKDGTDTSQEVDGTDGSQEGDGTDGSQEVDGTDCSQESDGTNDSQKDYDNDDGHKEICNKIDEADIFYGTHETQVSEGGEADLHKHLVGCKKNPGHTKFVPVNNLNISHLPEGHHDNDLVEFIKATADLTVRVDVKMTSTERPEFWPNTTVPYAFYNMRGSDVMRVATGMVWYVNKWKKKDNKGICRCHNCQHSDTPSNVWGKVRMDTATHVVFDDLEARHTTCRLFFDRQDSPLVTLHGWTVVSANIKEDRCVLECVTCDVDLLDKLIKLWRHLRDQLKKENRYKRSRDEVKLSFIVSHPHGCPKQVSVGDWINRYVVDMYHSTRYTYTTCTCPGSSGAYVHSLGYYDAWYYDRHVHSGVNSEGTNFSGIGLYYL